jgi:hypothetical protein
LKEFFIVPITGRLEAVDWDRGSCGRYCCVPSISIDERSNNSVWQRLQENDFKARGSFISENPAEQNSILNFPTSEDKLSDTS